ncbi:hypothetical protein [Fibrella aquatica]|uniref:hypothetical protein n=1 Tax=Fibrella aquatica TaxID=3242487 RepID=UPI003521E4B0
MVDEELIELHPIEQLDNPGVSAAYNIAGRLAKRLEKQWLLLLDQDTKLPIGFWKQYELSIEKYTNSPVHAPRLYDGEVLASPCGYLLYRGRVLTQIDAGITPMRGRNVLNSGLLVSVESFWKVGGYDESVGLYFSDFVFFDRLKNSYKNFAVVDIDLAHNLSSSDYSDLDVALHRFHLYCKGAYAASKGDPVKKFLYTITVGARSLLMNRRFSTFRFSRIFFDAWMSGNMFRA